MWQDNREICKKLLLNLAFKDVLSGQDDESQKRIKNKMELEFQSRYTNPKQTFQFTKKEELELKNTFGKIREIVFLWAAQKKLLAHCNCERFEEAVSLLQFLNEKYPKAIRTTEYK